jgi:hypothetical protein
MQFDVDAGAPTSDTPTLDRRARTRTTSRLSSKQTPGKDTKKKSSSGKKTKGGSADQLKEADLSTLEGQVEQIRVDLINSSNSTALEYYNILKNRKFNITRPDSIPPTQQELIEVIGRTWAHETQQFPSYCQLAIMEFRYQVVASYDLALSCEQLIFTLLNDFYHAKLIKEREQLQ